MRHLIRLLLGMVIAAIAVVMIDGTTAKTVVSFLQRHAGRNNAGRSLAARIASLRKSAETLQHQVNTGVKTTEQAKKEMEALVAAVKVDLDRETIAREAASTPPPKMDRWRDMVERLSSKNFDDIRSTIRDLQQMADEIGP